MPVQIGLVDGTRLTLTDDNIRTDDVVKQFSGRGDYTAVAFVALETRQGTFRVNPMHVVYVKEVEERSRTAGF